MPSDALEIVFVVTGADALQKSLLDGAKASDRAAQSLQKQGDAVRFVSGPYQRYIALNKQLAAATAAQNRPAMMDINRAMARTQQQLSPPRKAVRPERFTSGPRQRLAKLEEAHALALQNGKEDRAADLGHDIARTKKQIAAQDAPEIRKNADSFGKRFTQFLRTSRFNVGGGLSPLVGKTADLLGVTEGLVGKFSLLTTAISLAEQGMSNAAAAGNRVGAMNVQAGSSSTTSSALQNLGVSGDEAKSFNDRITSDPMAMGFASKFGISNAPGSFGNQDFGAELLKAMKGVKAIKDPTEQLREARALGIDGDWLNLSDNTFNRKVSGDAGFQGDTFNKQYTTDSKEFSESKEQLSQSWQNAQAKLFGPMMTFFTQAGNEFSADLNTLAGAKTNRMTLRRFFTMEGEDKYGNVPDKKGGDGNGADKGNVIDRNTKATEDLTNALGMSQRQYGHGERADSAIPRGQGMGSGYAVRQALQSHAFRLGAFGG